MKDLAIVLSESVFFPGYKKLDKKESKDKYQIPVSARDWVCKMQKDGIFIINISKWEQTELKDLLLKYDLPRAYCYNVHEDVKPGDFEYVIKMIMDYFNVSKENVIFVGGDEMKERDIEIVESLGINFCKF